MYKIIISCLFISLLWACGDDNKKVLIQTDYGDMTVELYNSTPIHRDNFIKLVKEGFYDDLLFHRVIQGFMIQGGDPDSRTAAPEQMLGQGGPGYTIPAEIGAPHFKGTLAAARKGGPANPEKRSSGSQFYIVQGKKQNQSTLQQIAKLRQFSYNDVQLQKYQEIGGTPELDMEYTVFGEVIDGMEVIDKIAAVQTGRADRPVKDVKMKIRLLN